MANLTDINNLFLTRKNQFDNNIYSEFWRTNPWASIFPRAEFDLEQGRIPEIITLTHELPTAYPFALPTLSLSSGTGSSCDVTPTIIKAGSKIRTYQLEYAAWETDVFCLTDLQFDYQVAQQVANLEQGLTEYGTVWLSDWYRVHNIGMLNRKASTTSATGMATKSDSLYDFSTLALPTFELNWIHLNQFYDQCIRRGMGKYALGSSGGMPTFSLNTGPGYKRALFQDEELVHETVNFSDRTLENFTARGITTAINGFMPNVDEFPIRFAADGTTAIYPTKNQAASNGRESVENPDYLTVANGGLAVYEVVTILCSGIYEVRARPVGPLGFGKQKFDPVNYAMETSWINNPDMGLNKQGNKGFYRIDAQMAAKPVRPQHGISILTLAKD